MTPPTLRLQVRSGPRAPRFPEEDEALGTALWSVLGGAVAKGQAPPAAFLFSSERVYVVGLVPIIQDPRHTHRVIAALAGMEGIEVVGLVGLLFRRRPGLPTWRYAVAFLEWPDGRWWLAQRRVDDTGRFAGDADIEVLRAVDDVPRPSGVGGWFSRARFEGLRARLDPAVPTPDREETVH